MKLLLIALSLVSSFAFASEGSLNMHYSGFEGRNRVFLSCDYAEDQTRYVLEKLGATNIQTNCFGGIQYGNMSPISIRAKYTTNTSRVGEVVDLTDSNGNCFFETALVEEILRDFPYTEILRERGHCFRSNSSYQFQIKL
jgi:hypothetical protein